MVRPITYDLGDRADRARVYEQVLREGTEADVRYYVDPEQLRELSTSSCCRCPCVEHGPTGFDGTAAPARADTAPRAGAHIVAGRAEARDFVDLMDVEPRYGLDRLCTLAAEKDRGFSPTVLADLLGRFRRLPRHEFPLEDTAYEQLRHEVERWREHGLELGRRHELDPRRRRDLGLER